MKYVLTPVVALTLMLSCAATNDLADAQATAPAPSATSQGPSSSGGRATFDISALVSLIAALSVASERLVEIVKGYIPWLNEQKKTDEKEEGHRKATLQLLAGIAGIVTAILSSYLQILPAKLDTPMGIFVLGLLTSGGSGFWNSILTYVKNVKDIKKKEATK